MSTSTEGVGVTMNTSNIYFKTGQGSSVTRLTSADNVTISNASSSFIEYTHHYSWFQ
jgi:hypothetical protein